MSSVNGRSGKLRDRAAFTLVELLVVIGIIAVLIGILIPVLGKAREQANRAKCMSNLRTISMAIITYAQDRKSMPGPANIGIADPDTVNKTAVNAPFTATEKRQQLSNGDVLQPYLKNSREVYFCPSSTAMREGARALSNGRLYSWCYKVNNQPDTVEPFFFGSWTSTRTEYERTPKRITMVRATNPPTDVTRPSVRGHSEIWMISDLDGRNFTKAHSATFGITDDAVAANRRPWQPPHRSGKIGRIYAFFDGHAGWVNIDDWPTNP